MRNRCDNCENCTHMLIKITSVKYWSVLFIFFLETYKCKLVGQTFRISLHKSKAGVWIFCEDPNLYINLDTSFNQPVQSRSKVSNPWSIALIWDYSLPGLLPRPGISGTQRSLVLSESEKQNKLKLFRIVVAVQWIEITKPVIIWNANFWVTEIKTVKAKVSASSGFYFRMLCTKIRDFSRLRYK